MCVFSTGGHTIGPTALKYGMEDHIYPWKAIGYISFWYPNPQGQGRPKSASGGPCSPKGAFLINFIKQKLKGTPALVGDGLVRSSAGIHQGVWPLVQVQWEGLLQWSLCGKGWNLAGLWVNGHKGVFVPWTCSWGIYGLTVAGNASEPRRCSYQVKYRNSFNLSWQLEIFYRHPGKAG